MMDTPIRFPHANLNHNARALDNAINVVQRKKCLIISITKPYLWKGKLTVPSRWNAEIEGRAAILVNKSLTYSRDMSRKDTVCIKIGKTNIISAYLSPNEEITVVLQQIM